MDPTWTYQANLPPRGNLPALNIVSLTCGHRCTVGQAAMGCARFRGQSWYGGAYSACCGAEFLPSSAKLTSLKVIGLGEPNVAICPLRSLHWRDTAHCVTASFSSLASRGDG
eukprot:2153042-Amphidinium_carterae.1